MATAEGIDTLELFVGIRKDVLEQNSSSGMNCNLLGKPLDTTDARSIVKPVLEHKEAATTAWFLPALRQGREGHLVQTLKLNTLKQAEGYIVAMRQGPEPPTLIPCALSRKIPRRLPQSIPKQLVVAGNLGIEDVESTALAVQAALKGKGPPPDGGPEYSLRSIRAAVEILKENQDKTVCRQSLVDKFKAGADNTARGYTFYSIGEKLVQIWDKYFPK